MSLRLKALLVVFQVSFLMWGIIIYAGYSAFSGPGTDVDLIATASTR
jgi:hypothetical protein